MFFITLMILTQAPLEDRYPDLLPLSDAHRFGSTAETAKLQFELWQRHRYWLRDARCRYPAWLGPDDQAIDETERCFAAWDQLDNALRGHHNEQYRRESLTRLRTILGDENYERGRMPPMIMRIVYPEFPPLPPEPTPPEWNGAR